MTTFFGAIADDLTGATDLAGLLARSGVPVSLRMGVPPQAPKNTAALEIIALKCRTAPVEDAVAQTRAALEWLRRAGAQRFFWKYCSTFDSTKKGNIGPVAEALMRDLGTEQTTYCPAFPENGRSIFMGNLFVGEQPLAESPMKDHPLTPMRDSNLMRLLATQVTGRVGLANRLTVAKGAEALHARLSSLAAEGVAHVILDAVADEDLHVIAQACANMVLTTGGSAVAMPLPGLWRDQGLITATPPAAAARFEDGPAIVLSGSCSSMTNRQVADFLQAGHPAYRLDPVELNRNGAGAAQAWLARQDPGVTPLIYATAEADQVRIAQDELGRDRAGEVVEQALAACAVAARDAGTRRFVIAGGETSGAVAKGLGIDRLNIGQEIAPGVPWCFAESAGMHIAITLKSGNFGAPTFFKDALRVLGND
ncbi:Uncharacterized conserved protein YgbK, DUF1537 family [Paracoccus halophilus]|uniref:3-oxo-tetronate kinase n=1 Tax=Paracoccus halophilus TaxID=376733 RepID=A0A099EVI6_9RHOB|nr:3-oxo-tetronate kinase [Paracoccus halophilus]KGJ01933.1 membrane protein [Paracoccus halophilus]SFA62390.1 Uncharacterized conserved protein YgbK, DUF1537 family [Paracoccus halophilus]